MSMLLYNKKCMYFFLVQYLNRAYILVPTKYRPFLILNNQSQLYSVDWSKKQIFVRHIFFPLNSVLIIVINTLYVWLLSPGL